MDETRRSFFIAFAATAVVFVVRLLLHPYLNNDAPFLIFTLAVAAAAILGGFRCGLLATLFSAALATFFFLTPRFSSSLTRPANILHLLVFLAVGVALSYQARLQQRTQKILRKNEEFLTKIVETTVGGILVVDVTGTITFANPAAAELFGLTTAHMVGRNVDEPGWGASMPDGSPVAPHDLPSRRILRGEKGLQGYRMSVRSASDALIPLAINASPLCDSGGKIAGVVLSLTRLPETVD